MVCWGWLASFSTGSILISIEVRGFMPVFDDKTSQEEIDAFNEHLRRDRVKRFTSEELEEIEKLIEKAKKFNGAAGGDV